MRIPIALLCLALAVPALAATPKEELRDVRQQVAGLLSAKQLTVVEQALAGWDAAVKGGDQTVVTPGFDAYLDAAVWNTDIAKTPKLESLLRSWSKLRAAAAQEEGQR